MCLKYCTHYIAYINITTSLLACFYRSSNLSGKRYLVYKIKQIFGIIFFPVLGMYFFADTASALLICVVNATIQAILNCLVCKLFLVNDFQGKYALHRTASLWKDKANSGNVLSSDVNSKLSCQNGSKQLTVLFKLQRKVIFIRVVLTVARKPSILWSQYLLTLSVTLL